MDSQAAFIFGAGIVLWLLLSYAGGLPGCIAGAAVVALGWLLLGLARWAGPSLLTIEALTFVLVLWVATRWTLRHRGWIRRLQKNRLQFGAERGHLEKGALHLKEALAAKGTDVERSLEQYELVKRLAAARSLKATSSILGGLVEHRFGAGAGWGLYLVSGQGKLRLVDSLGIPPDLQAGELPSNEPELQAFHTAWVLRIPLRRLHERIGLLLVTLPEIRPDERARILSDASDLGVQLIFPMARAQLYQELERASRRDSLTGFYRRGLFEERVQEEVARAQAFHQTFSLLRLEMSPGRDELLQTVSQRLKDSLYETDIIARLEGPNLLALLPNADLAGLKRKAESLQQQIKSQVVVVGLEAVPLSIHMGIAHFPQDGGTAEEILAASERALEAAKNAGQSAVVEAATVH